MITVVLIDNATGEILKTDTDAVDHPKLGEWIEIEGKTGDFQAIGVKWRYPAAGDNVVTVKMNKHEFPAGAPKTATAPQVQTKAF